MKRLIALSLLLFTSLVSLPLFAEVVVIVHPSNKSELTKEEVEKLFLLKNTKFPNGLHAEVLDRARGSAIRGEFFRKVANKQEAMVNRYWSRMAFSGKKIPPAQIKSDAEAIRKVAENPAAISFVEKSSIKTSNVRILMEL